MIFGGFCHFWVILLLFNFVLIRIHLVIQRDIGYHRTIKLIHAVIYSVRVHYQSVCPTGSPLVIGVEDTEDSKPKDGRC